MRCFCWRDENGELLAIGTGTGAGGVEITEEEYDRLLTEIREKASLVNRLYAGEITMDDVPAEWQEEIQRRVDERIAIEAEAAEENISEEERAAELEEALEMIFSGVTE